MRNVGMTDYDSVQHEYFNPVQIPNCVLWLDATDSSTITQVAGSVSQWNDKSGNGNNATQSTGSQQPITGSITLNGLNSITFNGSNSNLALPSALYSLGNGNNTIFVSFKVAGNLTSDQRILSGAGSVGGTSEIMLRLNSDFEFRDAISSSTATKSVTLNQTVAHIATMNFNGTTVTGYYDGGTAATSASGTSSIAQFIIGCAPAISQGFDGSIQDLIMYSSQLSNTQIDQVANWLAARSGASWTNI